MRVLFLTSPHEDYLADSLLHGLRNVLGDDVVDYPKCEQLYSGVLKPNHREFYGRGFTLYTGLLPDICIDRFDVFGKLRKGYFDWVVISNVWHQSAILRELASEIDESKIAIVDGADTSQCYPFAGKWMRSSVFWMMPGVNQKSPYFKREFTDNSTLGLVETFTPQRLRRFLRNRTLPIPIAFSFPSEKISTDPIVKTKLFPKHIVDLELLTHIPTSASSYGFQNEEEYYEDLRASKFGITTQRAGWDCMRHYEIAANAAVTCFRDLDSKPDTCAPHGLNRSNCLIYKDWPDLQSQIDSLSASHYGDLQLGAMNWISNNTTVKRASEFISVLLTKSQ